MLSAPRNALDELYGPALSVIHHEGYGGLATHAGPAIVALLQQVGIRSGLVVDLGCGSGILARYLTSRGYAVHGIDRSGAMLRTARRVAPKAIFIAGRAESVLLPRCAAVVATGESITYLSSRQRPRALLRRHIQRVARAVVPGGLFIFDAIIENAARPMAYKAWETSRDWAMLADVREDITRHVVERRITTFRRHGDCYRRSEEWHRVGVFNRTAVLEELRARGFLARTLPAYGAAALPPRRIVFVARRHRGARTRSRG